MLQQVKPEDFVIATGVSSTLETFVAQAFAHLDLDWQQYVRIRNDFLRASDIRSAPANPAKAQRLLGWNASTVMPHLVSG